ncbi:hypothetical protein BDZ89DRAFT_47413 [Hymenopellis radicata]|nr:hypothetical protein BDZ89DRAFT_47413 [Hymenopellis radicata]
MVCCSRVVSPSLCEGPSLVAVGDLVRRSREPRWSCGSSLVESCSLPVVVGRVSLLVGSSCLAPRRAWLAPLAPRVSLLVGHGSLLLLLVSRSSLVVSRSSFGYVLLLVAHASSFDRFCWSLILCRCRSCSSRVFLQWAARLFESRSTAR